MFENYEVMEVSKGVRFLNYIVDLICIMILNFIFGFGIGIVLLVLRIEVEAVPDLFFFFVGWITFYLYYFAFETTLQRTPGKFLTKTKVVSEDGNVPSTRMIAIRSIARLIPFEPIVGLFTAFWHDTIPGTKVVYS